MAAISVSNIIPQVCRGSQMLVPPPARPYLALAGQHQEHDHTAIPRHGAEHGGGGVRANTPPD